MAGLGFFSWFVLILTMHRHAVGACLNIRLPGAHHSIGDPGTFRSRTSEWHSEDEMCHFVKMIRSEAFFVSKSKITACLKSQSA